jgi:hypothetical protein
MATAEKNVLDAISLGLVFHGILRREMPSRRLSSYVRRMIPDRSGFFLSMKTMFIDLANSESK